MALYERKRFGEFLGHCVDHRVIPGTANQTEVDKNRPDELRDQINAALVKAGENQVVVARALWVHSSNPAGSWQEIIGHETRIVDRGVRRDGREALYKFIVNQGWDVRALSAF